MTPPPAAPLALWRLLAAVFPGGSRTAWKLRLRGFAIGLRHRRLLGRIVNAPAGGAMHRLMSERPEMLGALVWPYLSASWDAHERLRRIAGHYEEIDRLGPPYSFSIHERLTLAHIGREDLEATLVLDQPRWFLREGGLVLNLFLGNFRAFCLAFSLIREGDELIAVIGGLQGRNREGVLDIYRDLTKEMHGLRPRDLLIEAFRMLCREMGVTRIEAVADACRHHHHPYFKGKKSGSHQDYDAVWEDRGGIRLGQCFFEVPLAPERRDLETVKPKKRPMYRRRFDFLDALEAELSARLPQLRPEPAAEAE